ncbi:MAG: glutathione binding-like protein [Pseudomonadota bacterium]
MTAPIELYTWPTPNGFKVSIFLEEAGVPYNVHAIDIGAGDQFDPAFLEFSPNNKMPAMIDPEGPDGSPYSLFESGAMLMYLAEKHGCFWPQNHPARYDTVKWLMWQMAGFGPMLGQAGHFRFYAPEPVPYAQERYSNELRRLYGVLDRRLGETAFLAGDDYTIADMATFPWCRSYERHGLAAEEFPNFKRWYDLIGERAAVQRGSQVLADRRATKLTDEARRNLFGTAQYQRR